MDGLGVLLLFHILAEGLGDKKSPEHEAADAAAAALKKSGDANAAELKASAPGVAPVAVTPQGAAAPLATVPTDKGPALPAATPSAVPFASATPASLPPFPVAWQGGQPPGWEFAEDSAHHVAPEIVKRAQALLPQLWQHGAGTHVQEMTGGQWITYNAEWHDKVKGIKGVTAYRAKAAKAA
jgi:hypothetical protein